MSALPSTPAPPHAVAVVPVVMAGGSGTRLWPVSRDSFPKQFVPLLGTLSTFQATLKRVDDPALFGRPLIVTNEKFRFLAEEQAEAVGVAVDILMEPSPRDSAPAIAAAAHWVKQHHEGALGLVLAADHMIADVEGFRESVKRALPAAEAGKIVTFGVTPSHPSTAYGYIKPGDRIEGDAAAHVQRADSFRTVHFM